MGALTFGATIGEEGVRPKGEVWNFSVGLQFFLNIFSFRVSAFSCVDGGRRKDKGQKFTSDVALDEKNNLHPEKN